MRIRGFTPSILVVGLVTLIVLVGIIYFGFGSHFFERQEFTPTISPILTPSGSQVLSPPNSSCYSNPRQALDNFLDYLQEGDFINASKLYDGDYLIEATRITPESISIEDKEKIIAKFLGDHCIGYDTCLPHKTVSENKRSEDEFWYEVMFDLENGPYKFCGPYQGDPPQPTPVCTTHVKFTVKRIDGCFKNLDIPPITP